MYIPTLLEICLVFMTESTLFFNLNVNFKCFLYGKSKPIMQCDDVREKLHPKSESNVRIFLKAIH